MSYKTAITRQKTTGIGFRLNLVMFCVISFYLLTTYIGIQALLNQSRGFKEISGRHFERTMTAAELTRDAEVIAAQAIETVLGTNRSTSNENVLDEDLLYVYESVLDKLRAHSPEEKTQLEAIDRLKQPYIQSLIDLDNNLTAERELQSRKNAAIQQLETLGSQLHSMVNAPSDFSAYALETLNYTALALSAVKAGQLHRLQQHAESSLHQLQQMSLADQPQQALIAQLSQLTQTIFAERAPTLQTQRATLAIARQTRLHAQRLTSSSYSYFLTLKKSAQQAAELHEQAVSETFYMIALFSIAFLLLTLLTVVFIRHSIVKRLNRLNAAMNSHVAGVPVEVPQQGDDEISTMGSAFSVFVSARNTAEAELVEARRDAEQANEELRKLNQYLLTLSEVDNTTQISNRRFFDKNLAREWRRAARNDAPVGLIMIDIDYFKSFNDQYGHQAGDRCLYEVAQILKNSLQREAEFVARYGGEEFVILLPGSSLTATQTMAQMLLESVIDANLQHAKNPRGIVTLSMGVAVAYPLAAPHAEQLIARADSALYAAKHNGRCRIETAPEPLNHDSSAAHPE